jgi:hypothetical protein
MQMDPLLEQLDWFFTSPNWTIDFPDTEVLALAKITSDHVPCKISISTRIPKANIFRFENFWAVKILLIQCAKVGQAIEKKIQQ